MKGMNKIGNNAIPWLASAVLPPRPWMAAIRRVSRTGYAALEAGGTALLALTGLKSVFGRARRAPRSEAAPSNPSP